MTIEQSNGKARPTLPRAREAHVVAGTDAKRHRNHGADGRFTTANEAARGRGWKGSIAKLIGHDVADVDDTAKQVAADAWRTYCQTLRELPHDGPTVRGLAALMARHSALAAFWNARAALVGLASDEGVKAQDMALKHGQRAERLSVTMLDVAGKLAVASKASTPLDYGAIEAEAEAETEARREQERAARGQAAPSDEGEQ